MSFMSVSYWLRLDRSHTSGSSLQLGLVARLGLVAGGDTVGMINDNYDVDCYNTVIQCIVHSITMTLLLPGTCTSII